jgi:hypothetical protein
MIDTVWILLVLSFEFGLAGLSVSPREYIGYQLIVLTELRKSLPGVITLPGKGRVRKELTV